VKQSTHKNSARVLLPKGQRFAQRSSRAVFL